MLFAHVVFLQCRGRNRHADLLLDIGNMPVEKLHDRTDVFFLSEELHFDALQG